MKRGSPFFVVTTVKQRARPAPLAAAFAGFAGRIAADPWQRCQRRATHTTRVSKVAQRRVTHTTRASKVAQRRVTHTTRAPEGRSASCGSHDTVSKVAQRRVTHTTRALRAGVRGRQAQASVSSSAANPRSRRRWRRAPSIPRCGPHRAGASTSRRPRTADLVRLQVDGEISAVDCRSRRGSTPEQDWARTDRRARRRRRDRRAPRRSSRIPVRACRCTTHRPTIPRATRGVRSIGSLLRERRRLAAAIHAGSPFHCHQLPLQPLSAGHFSARTEIPRLAACFSHAARRSLGPRPQSPCSTTRSGAGSVPAGADALQPVQTASIGTRAGVASAKSAATRRSPASFIGGEATSSGTAPRTECPRRCRTGRRRRTSRT